MPLPCSQRRLSSLQVPTAVLLLAPALTAVPLPIRRRPFKPLEFACLSATAALRRRCRCRSCRSRRRLSRHFKCQRPGCFLRRQSCRCLPRLPCHFRLDCRATPDTNNCAGVPTAVLLLALAVGPIPAPTAVPFPTLTAAPAVVPMPAPPAVPLPVPTTAVPLPAPTVLVLSMSTAVLFPASTLPAPTVVALLVSTAVSLPKPTSPSAAPTLQAMAGRRGVAECTHGRCPCNTEVPKGPTFSLSYYD